MKNRLWIVFFGLAVLAYGLSQYWQEQRSNKFESMLLDFVPKDVERIDIQKADRTAFSIIRNQQRWLLSRGHLNEAAAAEPVEELLRRLRAIRTSALVSQRREDWSEYGVGADEGILVCLHFRAKPQDCVRIGKYIYSQTERRVQAYTRLENQKEVFTINGLALSIFTGELDAFRHKQLLRIDNDIDSLKFLQDGRSHSLQPTTTGNYLLNNTPTDSLRWNNYLQLLTDLQGQGFADDFDELNLDSLRYWQLQVFSGGDSTLLDCYRDTTRQMPYLLNTTQFPGTWIAADSLGIHRQLSNPWLKTLQYE